MAQVSGPVRPKRNEAGVPGGPMLVTTSSRRLPPAAPEGLAALQHDTRNVLAALEIFCELLRQPGILMPGKEQYADDLAAISEASLRLLARMEREAEVAEPRRRKTTADIGTPIEDLAAATDAMRGLLASVAGSRIALELQSVPCPGMVRICVEDLTRILVNLVRNASEALAGQGHIRITVQPIFEASEPDLCVALLAVEDDGPGISSAIADRIFEQGFSTRTSPGASERGQGLPIVRSLVERAGGWIRMRPRPGSGARFEIGLPVTATTLTNVTGASPRTSISRSGLKAF